MKRFSLRGRLLLLLLGSVVAVWAVMLAVGYDEAREEIQGLADARMQQGARTLLALDLKRLGRLAEMGDARSPDGGQAQDQAGYVRPLAFQVWSDRGQLLLASPGAPPVPFQPTDGYATTRVDGSDWRTFNTLDVRHGYRLTVLEPLSVREHPAHELAGRVGMVVVWALPLLALLVWLSVRHGLKPLGRLSGVIGARDAGNLEPIAGLRVPTEVEPLVHALNGLLDRLSRSLDRERTFTADAAHELRTPLAAIKVQAEVALAAKDEAVRRHAIGQVIAGVDRSAHLAQQLLTLARLEHVDAAKHQAVDLAALAATVVARRAGDATARAIDLELAAEPGCVLPGDAATLGILIDNLLDNAIKYGKAGGHIVVGIRREAETLLVEVADDGPGVADADRRRLRDRFFRAEGHAVPGSGLGLSIVERIAAAHGGTLDLGSGLKGRGLGATVRFQVHCPR